MFMDIYTIMEDINVYGHLYYLNHQTKLRYFQCVCQWKVRKSAKHLIRGRLGKSPPPNRQQGF